MALKFFIEISREFFNLTLHEAVKFYEYFSLIFSGIEQNNFGRIFCDFDAGFDAITALNMAQHLKNELFCDFC